MYNRIIQRLMIFHQRSFIQIAQKTLVSLFPFLLLSAVARVISLSVFSPYGYINQLFNVSSWLPFYTSVGNYFTNFTAIIGGAFGLLTTYFSAKYTAGHYGRSTGTVGITAFFFSLIINSRELFAAPLNDGLLTRVNLPVDVNLLVAILIGYLVGQIFRWTSSNSPEYLDRGLTYQPRQIRPIFLSLLLATILNSIFYLGMVYNVYSTIGSFFSNLIVSKNNLITSFTNAFWVNLSAWIGNSSAYTLSQFNDDALASTNLNYALKQHTTVGIPHLYTDTTLFYGFGAVAGLGATLALILAILWVSHNQKHRRLGLQTLFTALFNNGSPLMIGIPVFFNLLFLVPFIFLPWLNMLIAYLALRFELMPPVVYPVPDGTPSLLYAFIGSGGSLRALAIALICFALDVLAYLPFVKIHDAIYQEVREKGASYDQEN